MRYLVYFALSSCAFLFAWSGPHGATAAQAATTKTLNFYRGTIGSEAVTINGLLRLRYSGAKIASAELDVCFPAKAIGSSEERFVLPLQVAANGQLSYDKPDGPGDIRAIKLRFQGKSEEIRLNGSIRRGTSTILVKDENMSLVDEAAPETTGQPEEESVDRSVTTNNIMFDVKPKLIGGALEVLKTYPVGIPGQSLIPTCQDQRDDRTSFTLTVQPRRIDEMLAVIKKIPGAFNVQKGNGSFSRSDAILVPKLDGATGPAAVLDRATKVIEQETGGKLASMQRDEDTGSYSLVVALPPTTMNGLSVKKQATIEALVEPAADVKGAHVLFWQVTNYKLSLDGAKEKFKIEDVALGGEGGSSDDMTPWKPAMARAFKGKTWDDEKKSWKP